MDKNDLNNSTLRKLNFVRIQQGDEIYYKDYLDAEYRNSKHPLPENIRKARNIAIVLGLIEFICCIASIAFYVRRRSRIILAIIVLAFFASALGTYAKVTLNFWCLFIHAAFTIAVIGGLYIYLIIECCAGTDKGNSNGMNETTVLVLLSLPLLFIFLMGIYSLVLLLMLDEEIEERMKSS